jgi:hypothetical protein
MITTDQLNNGINEYEKAVEDTIKSLMPNFIIDILFLIVIPIVISMIALIATSIGGMLATLGLGVINISERLGRTQTVLKTYWSDRSTLKRTVQTLKLKIALCDKNDPACLEQVKNLLLEYINKLTSVVQPAN